MAVSPFAAYPRNLCQEAADFVLQARKVLKEPYGISRGIEYVQEAYSRALVLIHQRFKEQKPFDGDPTRAALELVDLLSYKKTQCEHEFKKEVAKTTRVFMDLALLVHLPTNHHLSSYTQIEIMDKLHQVLNDLPPNAVDTRYYTLCSYAAASFFNCERSLLQDVILSNLEVLSALKPPPQCDERVKRVFETTRFWFVPVFIFHLQHRVSRHLEPIHQQEFLYARAKDITHETTLNFCFLEALSECGNSLIDPAFSTFVVYATSWEVRYKAICVLFKRVLNPQVAEEVSLQCSEMIVLAAAKEDHREILQLLENSANKLKNSQKEPLKKRFIVLQEKAKAKFPIMAFSLAQKQQEVQVKTLAWVQKKSELEGTDPHSTVLEEQLQKDQLELARLRMIAAFTL